MLKRFIFNKYYILFDNITEFRPKIQQLGELMEKGVQIIYLIIILLLYIELEFINIIRIKTNDIYIFRSPINRPNIVYSVVKYEENKFGRGDIIAICKLIK